MKKNVLLGLFFSLFLMQFTLATEETYTVFSPDSQLKLQVGLKQGVPYYAVSKNEKKVIEPSSLGFSILDIHSNLQTNFQVINTKTNSFKETWEQVWGESRWVENNYNEIILSLETKDERKRQINLIFRVFDDGVGFRYTFPEQASLNYFIITEEHTEFKFAGNNKAWWIPSHAENSYYESLYRLTTFTDMRS